MSNQNIPQENTPLLSQDMVDCLIIQLAKGHADRGITEDDALKLVEWAELTSINFAILHLLLEGTLVCVIDPESGDVLFTKLPEFDSTE
jgi:hypothetical protein